MTGSDDGAVGGEVFEVTLSGEVDVARSSELEGVALAFGISSCPSIRVDLAAVTFIDSSGLGMLAQLRNIALNRGGHAVLVDPAPSCLKTFRLVGFDQAFTIERTTH